MSDTATETPTVEDPDTDTPETESTETTEEPDTFPRSYVEELRKESARYRERAKTADDLAARLHSSLVAATGRLADPSDLPFDDAHLADANALTAAIDDLLASKPHLASRRPTGDVGQGARPVADTVGLGGLLRANL